MQYLLLVYLCRHRVIYLLELNWLYLVFYHFQFANYDNISSKQLNLFLIVNKMTVIYFKLPHRNWIESVAGFIISYHLFFFFQIAKKLIPMRHLQAKIEMLLVQVTIESVSVIQIRCVITISYFIHRYLHTYI